MMLNSQGDKREIDGDGNAMPMLADHLALFHSQSGKEKLIFLLVVL